MAAALLSDALWDVVEPFLPTPPPRPKGGWPRVSDRACLTGILFVLRSGIPCRGMTCGAACAIGNERVCGILFTSRCWIGSLETMRSSGRERWWTVVLSAPCTAVTRLVRTLPIAPSAGASGTCSEHTCHSSITSRKLAYVSDGALSLALRIRAPPCPREGLRPSE
jgi:putative transposase of IS4/5 family DUF4096